MRILPTDHRVPFAFETVWAAAGSPFSVFEIAPAELRRANGGRRGDLKA